MAVCTYLERFSTRFRKVVIEEMILSCLSQLKVRTGSENVVYLADYSYVENQGGVFKILWVHTLIHKEGAVVIESLGTVVLWDLDWSYEKASSAVEHSFDQTMNAQISMRECSSYLTGREIDLFQNISIELGEQHRPECPHTYQNSCFQLQEQGPNYEKHPHIMMLSVT
ncbi:hypothetical protein TNCV_3638141 [Trichonephila clavipes]|nr:hypothetical protein TNCV_3638141 [Trichonephila clavipes]